ncbi:MAG: cytidine deaminase [Nanoarchaeota archaeon]|nr:cytidine deaminase [Nanoarchaeota archaeon]
MHEIKLRDLLSKDKQLIEEAERVMSYAYNPYSNFFVGAALRTNDGQVFSSANVENSAYGSTICAERGAIMHANAHGQRLYEKLALIGKGKDFESEDVITPCGSCRQMLYEFSSLNDKPLEIIMCNTRKDKIKIATIDELLSMAFGPKELGFDLEKLRNP